MKSMWRVWGEKLLVWLMVVVIVAFVLDSIYQSVFSVSLFSMLSSIPWDLVKLVVLGGVLLAVVKWADVHGSP